MHPGPEDQLWSFVTAFVECSITFPRNACLALRSVIFFDLWIPLPSGLLLIIITIEDLLSSFFKYHIVECDNQALQINISSNIKLEIKPKLNALISRSRPKI